MADRREADERLDVELEDDFKLYFKIDLSWFRRFFKITSWLPSISDAAWYLFLEIKEQWENMMRTIECYLIVGNLRLWTDMLPVNFFCAR